MSSVYLIGSLRNPEVPSVANKIRELGYDVFDDWYAAGPEADDYWQAYERQRGRSYAEALEGFAANHVFDYDHSHLKRCDLAVLLLPAGKSGHLEFGYFRGLSKPGIICIPEEPERYDVMYRFASSVVVGEEALLEEVKKYGDIS
jgi:hypothetical protein